MLEPPTLGVLARTQLAAWQQIAADWLVYEDPPILRCASCYGLIYRTHDEHGTAYRYTPEQTLAATVAHLRRSHMDLDPDR